MTDKKSWIPAFAGMTRGKESSNLRLIEIVTLLPFLPEREEDLEPTQRADRL